METKDPGWNPHDHKRMRQMIEEGTVTEWERQFPLRYGNVVLNASNIRMEGREHFTLADQRKAWMENRMLTRPLKADIELSDAESGEVLDRRVGHTLMRVPYYTNRGNFVFNGSNYPMASQSRLMPGAYTRRQNNGGLETQFNVRPGTGRMFRVALEPETGQFRLRSSGSNLHLYSVLKDAGVSDEDMKKAWGDELFDINKGRYDSRSLNKAFMKMVPSYARKDAKAEDAAALLIEALNRAQIMDSVRRRTLAGYWDYNLSDKTASMISRVMLRGIVRKMAAGPPEFDIRTALGDKDDEGDLYVPVGVPGVLAATKKLLAVNRGQDELDERNTPAFSKIYTPDRIMRERIRLDEGKIRRNLMRMLARRRNLDALRPRYFDPYYEEVITKHPLTSPIEETNPLQNIAQQRRVTMLGPGGIGADEAVTPDMQAVQPSEFGFFSPLEGPESGRAGVDVRLSWGVHIGSDGRMRRRFKDLKSGKHVWASPEDLVGKRLRFPD